MANTSLLYTRQISEPLPGTLPADQSGVRLDYAVTHAHLIAPNPFIFQRNITGPGSEDFEDYFYSVASVAQMESLSVDEPAEDEVFYLSSTAQLVFGNYDLALEASMKIESALAMLCEQNDASLDLAPAQLLGYPLDAGARFWGASDVATLTDELLLAQGSEPCPTLTTTKTIDTGGTAKYLFLAYPSSLGVASFTLNSVAEAMTLVSRDVVNSSGLTVPYHIYRTTVTRTGSALILSATPTPP